MHRLLPPALAGGHHGAGHGVAHPAPVGALTHTPAAGPAAGRPFPDPPLRAGPLPTPPLQGLPNIPALLLPHHPALPVLTAGLPPLASTPTASGALGPGPVGPPEAPARSLALHLGGRRGELLPAVLLPHHHGLLPAEALHALVGEAEGAGGAGGRARAPPLLPPRQAAVDVARLESQVVWKS